MSRKQLPFLNIFWVIFFLISVVVPGRLAFAEAKTGKSTVLNMVIVSIDGDPLTTSDLRAFIKSIGQTPPADIHSGGREIRQYIRELVITKLIEREASKSGISVSEEEIQRYIDQIKTQNGVDHEQFVELLKGQDLTLEAYRSQVRQDIVRARVISSKVRTRVSIVDEDIERFLETNPERRPEAGSVLVEQIFYRYQPQDGDKEKAAARELILTARSEILAGADFANIDPANYANLGYVKLGDLREDLQRATAKLEPGEVSEVVHSDAGLYLLRVTGSSEDKLVLDKRLKEEIRRELFETRLKEEVNKYFNEELPDKYNVEIKL